MGRSLFESGDQVIVTSRSLNGLNELREKYDSAALPLKQDITDRAACFNAAAKAKAHFGRIDLVINNAGPMYSARRKN
jgi:NADP-dependent 3-hydroxy acid dehydrogenase YdfG